MRFSEQIRPISYSKDNAAKVIKDITESGEPLIITQNGEATCVVQDIKRYEQGQETMALLKILALGRRQVEQGQVFSEEEIFAEMDEGMESITGTPR